MDRLIGLKRFGEGSSNVKKKEMSTWISQRRKKVFLYSYYRFRIEKKIVQIGDSISLILHFITIELISRQMKGKKKPRKENSFLPTIQAKLI